MNPVSLRWKVFKTHPSHPSRFPWPHGQAAASGGVAMSEKKISVVAPIAIATITANEKNLGPRDKTMEYHGPSGFSSCTASKKAATFLHVSVCVCNVWIDVKLLVLSVPFVYLYYIILYYNLLQGVTGVPGGRWPTKTPPRDPWKRTCGTVVAHLGAYKSQLVATIVPSIYIYKTN